MQSRKGIIYPRIAEEVVDYAELQSVWGCSYQTAYRIIHGFCPPNHRRKEKLSEYLGIPSNELWEKDTTVEVRVYRGVSEPEEKPELTEEEKRENYKKYQHEYYLNKTKVKRAENRRINADQVDSELPEDASPSEDNS